MAPILLESVARADTDVVGQYRFAGDLQDVVGFAGCTGAPEIQSSALHLASTGNEGELVVRSTQPLRLARAVRPDASRIFEDSASLLIFLDDRDDGEVAELDDRVNPEEVLTAGYRRICLASRRFRFADRSHTPGPIAITPPRLRGDRDDVAVDGQGSGPCSGLHESLRVEGDSSELAMEMSGLEIGGAVGLEGEVEAQVRRFGTRVQHHT